MTEITPSSQPNFFGKDNFVPWQGQVENVNDPKRAGRVQVRIVGWHPKEKEGDQGLATGDLPWCKVGYPVTHAQQARVGGKHGLQPGSWVWGYYLDGEDAQDPFIVQSFNFTPKASEEDNRTDIQGRKGKLEESDPAFGKFGSTIGPTIAHRTADEQGQKGTSNKEDPAGDVPNDESFGECDGSPSRQSAAAERRMIKPMKKGEEGNTESQHYEVGIGDGLCGTNAHARDDIAKKMKEMFPSELSRFSFNDQVWNAYTGQFMNLNGIFAQLALEMSNTMKMPLMSMKSVTEEAQRIVKGTAMIIPDRDGVITQAADLATTTVSDMLHGIFGSQMIDMLFQTMMGQLKSLNNDGTGGSSGGGSSDEGNSGYPGHSSPTTKITNNEALCLTDTILENISILTDEALEGALKQAQADYDNDPEGTSSGGSGSSAGAIMGMLGGLSSVMQFPLTQKYSVFATIFNKAGPMSQDILTKDRGCANEREYNTGLGTMASKMGFGGQGGSGGGGSSADTGSSGGGSRGNEKSPGNNDPTTVGFGGLPISDRPTAINYEACDAARSTPVLDPVYGGGGNNPGGGQVTPTPGTGSGNDPFEGGTPGTPNFGGIPNNNVGIPPEAPRDGEPTQVVIPANPENPEVNTPGSLDGTSTGTETIAFRTAVDENGQLIQPRGQGAIAIAVSIPASTIVAADNFSNGIPNNIVILDGGRRYFYNNVLSPERAYPSIYIPGYNGVPTPVVDRRTGELVAITTEAGAFNATKPNPKVTLIPDDSPTGITTDDPKFDVRLAGFFIENTGFNYDNPTIEIVDRDNPTNVAKARVITSSKRIVEISIINSGTRFMRLPEVTIKDDTGFGCKVHPIMAVTVRPEYVQEIADTPTEVIFCPSKNQQNLS